MLVDVSYGKENFPQASSQLWLFYVPLVGPGETRRNEVHLWAAAKEPATGVRKVSRGGADAVPASLIGDRQLGTWSDNRFDLPEGTVLKLFATKKTSWSSLKQSAIIYIRVRNGAALRRFHFDTTRTQRLSSRETIEAINGRFDVLTPGEVANMGGPLMPSHLQPAATRAMVDALFREEIIAPETQQVPLQVRTIMHNSEGEQVTVATARRRRVLED